MSIFNGKEVLLMGLKGDKGERGERGERGEQGEKGEQGQAGEVSTGRLKVAISSLFEIRGKNIIDLSSVEKGAVTENGEITTIGSYEHYNTSGYLKIDGETHVVSVIDTISGELYATRIITVLFDKDMNVIEGSYVNQNEVSRVISNANAVYMRVSVVDTHLDGTLLQFPQTQVEKGDTPTAWSGYGEKYLLGRIGAEQIVPTVLLREQAEEVISPIVKSQLQNSLFEEHKNLFYNAQLFEGCYSSAGQIVETLTYNVFRVTLQAGNYAIYPQCRFVANVTEKTNISATNVENEVFTFSLTKESVIDVSFYATNTASMTLYNADLYTYEDVENYSVNILDTTKVIVPTADTHGNILMGKKWAVCGDSFSQVLSTDTGDSYIEGGKYSGYKKSYGYIIANRNDMTIQHLAEGGKTLAYPADGTFHNSFTDISGLANYNYTDIDEDIDYITLYFGINDSHHESGTSGTDGEDVTGVIPLGTVDDVDNTSFCGAWNVCLEWLIKNRPFAHIGIIVSNGCDRDEYRTSTIAIANKWGIPYIDLNGDERTPMMLRSTNPAFSRIAKEARLKAQSIKYDEPNRNLHPNAKALEYEATFIEAFLRTL